MLCVGVWMYPNERTTRKKHHCQNSRSRAVIEILNMTRGGAQGTRQIGLAMIKRMQRSGQLGQELGRSEWSVINLSRDDLLM